MRRRRPDDGFSLVELIVAIVILGVLSAVAIMSVSRTNTNAPRRCEADFEAVRIAAGSYYASNANTFAPDVPTLKASGVLKADPPAKPTSGPITVSIAPHGYAIELQTTSDQPLVHAWGVDKVWATGDDRSGSVAICTEAASGL